MCAVIVCDDRPAEYVSVFSSLTNDDIIDIVNDMSRHVQQAHEFGVRFLALREWSWVWSQERATLNINSGILAALSCLSQVAVSIASNVSIRERNRHGHRTRGV